MCQKKLTEAHLVEIYELCVNTYLSPWLTTEDIRDVIKQNIRQEKINEGHVLEIMKLSVNGYLSDWLTRDKTECLSGFNKRRTYSRNYPIVC
jgi:hypothetical protein